MGNTIKPNSFKEFYEQTSFGIADKTIKEQWHKNKKIIKIDLAVTGTLSLLAAGYVYTIFIGLEKPFFLLYLVYGLIKVPWLSVILLLVMNRFTYNYLAAIQKTAIKDSERNYESSKDGGKGTAHKMTEEEKKETLSCGNYLEQKDNIFGCEPGDITKLYSLRKDLYGKNGNMLVVGAPGCGKSRCVAIPIIMQTVRRGESLIVTDPKGELYRDTAALAKANGYVVKILNFRPKDTLHTDTCNFMSVLGGSAFKSQSFSKTVIDNTSDGKPADFWTESEFNLYMGVCIWVNNNDLDIPKTMGGIYQFLYSYTVNEFEEVMSSLPDDHPAMPYLKTFMNGDKTVKGNTYAGLQIRLSALADPLVQKIVGVDDIDFTLPGKQKCIYYISSPDTDKSRSYLVALFFTLLYNELIDLADEQESGHLPIRVTMLLDEFKNIGVIPAFPEKLSTVRSRWIDTISIIQGLEQLMTMYPDNEWETIMNDCTTRILINTNNNITAEYFSKLSGEQTTEEYGVRYEENAGDLLKIHPTYTVSKSHGSRVVYTPNEIQQLNPKHLLVFISQVPVVELEKIDYTNHPMCKEMRKWVPRFHAPKWILELPEKDRLKYHVYDEIYKRESINDIELCTEDDFREPWNKKKEAALQERIEKLKSKQEKGLSKSSETNATNELEKNVSISSDSNETNTSSTNHLSDYTSITESTETEKKNPKNNQFSAFDNYIAKSNVVSQDQTSPKFVCIKKAYDNTAEKTENIINESIEKAKSSVEEIMFQKFPDINDNETWKKIPKVEEEDTVNITSYDDDLQNELDEYENPEMEGFQDFMLSMNSTTPESDSSDFMTSLNDIPEPDMEIIVPEFLEKESND